MGRRQVANPQIGVQEVRPHSRDGHNHNRSLRSIGRCLLTLLLSQFSIVRLLTIFVMIATTSLSTTHPWRW